MAGSFMSGAAATTPMMDSYIPARLDETLLWRYSPYWFVERRSVHSANDRYGWRPLWPGGQMMSGDPSSPMGNLGQCADSGGELYEPYSCIGNGNQSMKFIRGTCLDGSAVAVAAATVQAFRTSDDAIMGESTTYSDGTYAVPSAAPGVAHYLVAYKAGSPDIAGTTVNTLVPTNIDGS